MWTHIVVEGYCAAEENDSDQYPCGQHVPSPFCLGNKRLCPYFGYAKSNEREAAVFVPLYLVVWDRLRDLAINLARSIEWHLWNRWFWDSEKFMKHIEQHQGERPEWDNYLEKAKAEFPEWLEKARASEEGSRFLLREEVEALKRK